MYYLGVGEGVGEGFGEGVGEGVGTGVGLHMHTRTLKHKHNLRARMSIGGLAWRRIDRRTLL